MWCTSSLIHAMHVVIYHGRMYSFRHPTPLPCLPCHVPKWQQSALLTCTTYVCCNMRHCSLALCVCVVCVCVFCHMQRNNAHSAFCSVVFDLLCVLLRFEYICYKVEAHVRVVQPSSLLPCLRMNKVKRKSCFVLVFTLFLGVEVDKGFASTLLVQGKCPSRMVLTQGRRFGNKINKRQLWEGVLSFREASQNLSIPPPSLSSFLVPFPFHFHGKTSNWSEENKGKEGSS